MTCPADSLLNILLSLLLMILSYWLGNARERRENVREKIKEIETLTKTFETKGCEFHIKVANYSEEDQRIHENCILSDKDTLFAKLENLRKKIPKKNYQCIMDNYAELSKAITEAPFRANKKSDLKVSDYRLKQIQKYSIRIISCLGEKVTKSVYRFDLSMK